MENDRVKKEHKGELNINAFDFHHNKNPFLERPWNLLAESKQMSVNSVSNRENKTLKLFKSQWDIKLVCLFLQHLSSPPLFTLLICTPPVILTFAHWQIWVVWSQILQYWSVCTFQFLFGSRTAPSLISLLILVEQHFCSPQKPFLFTWNYSVTFVWSETLLSGCSISICTLHWCCLLFKSNVISNEVKLQGSPI